MRPVRALALIAALVLLAGCGDRRLVVRVDVLSFLAPSETRASFGPVPAVPGGLYAGEAPLVDNLGVNLFEGLSGVAEVRSVTVTVSTIFTDSTGSGADTMRVYLSEEGVNPRTTPPVLTLAVVLVPGVTDTVSAVLGDDPRVADLFAKQRLRLSVTTALRGPASGPDLNGRLRLRALDAVVIAGRKLR
jgi:hypothetical protein